jgi:hypothetical protein
VVDDGVDSMGQDTDGARLGKGDVVADDAATGSILLVGNVHCCFCGGVEHSKGCGVRDDGVSAVVEGDVACLELFGSAAILLAVSSVFPDA